MQTFKCLFLSIFFLLFSMNITVCHAFEPKPERATDEEKYLVRDTVALGNLAKLQKIITERPELLKLSYSGSILQYPIYYNKPEMLHFLIKNGAELNPQGMESGVTCAVKYGKPPFNREAVKILLEYGALVDGGNVSGEGARWTPYIEALKINDLVMAKLLLDNGADGAYVSKYGENALTNILYLAHATRMDLKTVQFAVEDGKANVNHVKSPGTDQALTPLLIVAKIDRRDIYDYLVSKGADSDFRNAAGLSPKDFLKK